MSDKITIDLEQAISKVVKDELYTAFSHHLVAAERELEDKYNKLVERYSGQITEQVMEKLKGKL